MYAWHIFLFRCVIPSKFILMDELPTSQWYEWGWSSPISISWVISAHYSHLSFLLVPLLVLGDSPKFLGSLEGLLYRSENENCMCDISYMYIRGSHKIYLYFFVVVFVFFVFFLQDISLNERAVSSLLCQKWLEP